LNAADSKMGARGAGRRIALGLAGIAALCLGGCSDSLESFGGPTMGSTYTVQYVRSSGMPAAEALQAEVEKILAGIDQQMSTYRSDSFIERFNEAPAGCQPAPASVLKLVEYGEGLSRSSDGAFDLTLEPLMNLWGFGPKGGGLRVPSAEELQAVRALYGHRHLRVAGAELCKDRDEIQVDLNSIAAGHAVDLIGERLEQLGVKSYLVEATGELKAVGRKPDGSPWKVAIEAPQSETRVPQMIVALDGYAMTTAGDYRNFFEQNGQRYSHTLDPSTASPVAHALAAVTVVDPSALNADGLDTLLMVLGPERGLAYAEREGIAAFFVSHDGQGFVARGSSAFDALMAAQQAKR
jgi:thiamine biosynthesis lipoprotein